MRIEWVGWKSAFGLGIYDFILFCDLTSYGAHKSLYIGPVMFEWGMKKHGR